MESGSESIRVPIAETYRSYFSGENKPYMFAIMRLVPCRKQSHKIAIPKLQSNNVSDKLEQPYQIII